MKPAASIAILAVALAARAGFAAWLYASAGEAGFLINDSGDYLRLAASGADQSQIMPLYLKFLALHAALLGPSPLWPVITQIAVDGAACLAIARLAQTFDPRLGLAAGLFAALNPTQIVMATLILTDSLFLFFTVLSLLAAARWLAGPSWRLSAALGLALGLGLWTRAMLLPWVLVLPALLLLARWLRGGLRLRAEIAPAVAAAALALAMQAPVVAVNHAKFGGWGLTAQSGAYALLWLVPLTMEAKDGTPHAEGARRMEERFPEFSDPAAFPDPFARGRAMARAAAGVLAEIGPAAIAKAWAYGAAINLLSPAVILATPVRALPRTGFYDTPGESKLAKIEAFLFRNDNRLYGWVLLIAALGTAACRLVQLRGLWRGLAGAVRGERAIAAGGLLLVAWIGFLLAVNGPIASAKYRSPSEPALAVLFALGAVRRERDG